MRKRVPFEMERRSATRWLCLKGEPELALAPKPETQNPDTWNLHMNRNQIIAQLKGIFAPVVTPFNRRGDIDAGAFQHNLRRYAGIGLGGIVVAGSTGEAPYLAERERLRLVELARQVVRPPELLMVGTGL